MSAPDITASTLLFGILDCLAEHEQLGRPVPVDLCGDLCAGLRDLGEHVMALEAVARAAGLLERREFAATVTSLPVTERRALARAALARANGAIVPLALPRGRVPIGMFDRDGGDAA